MKNVFKKIIECYVLGMIFAGISSFAMSAPGHEAGIELLFGTNASKGGIGTMKQGKMVNIGKWIDHPATQTGKYINHKAGGVPVAPWNHNALRHNPDAVARALSGTGQIDDAVRNAARMHKIQDVAHNVRDVDGWKITPRLKKEAQKTLKYVEKHKRLPSKLPHWVDKSGPNIANRTSKSLVGKGDDLAKVAIRGKKLTKVGTKVLLPVFIATEGAFVYSQGKSTENAYLRGEIGQIERSRRHTQNTSRSATGIVGAWAGAVIGSAFGPIGTGAGIFCGAVAGDYVGRTVGGFSHKIYGKHAQRRLDLEFDSMKHLKSTCGERYLTGQDLKELGLPETWY